VSLVRVFFEGIVPQVTHAKEKLHFKIEKKKDAHIKKEEKRLNSKEEVISTCAIRLTADPKPLMSAPLTPTPCRPCFFIRCGNHARGADAMLVSLKRECFENSDGVKNLKE